MQTFSTSSRSNSTGSTSTVHHNDYRSVQDAPSPRLHAEHAAAEAEREEEECRQLHGLEGPDFHSRRRTTQLRPAVFSLVNTVVGGGTLSLAYSFQKAGTVIGTLCLALVCLATDFTLFAMISASRRTGEKSYEGVMKAGA